MPILPHTHLLLQETGQHRADEDVSINVFETVFHELACTSHRKRGRGDTSWCCIDSTYDIRVLLNLFIYPPICLSVCLSVCLPVCLSICLSLFLSICLSVCLSVCMPIYLSIYRSLGFSISVPLFPRICFTLSQDLGPSLVLYSNLYLYLCICLHPMCIEGRP